MKSKVSTYKGFKIKETKKQIGDNLETVYEVFTADEWSMGEGYRYSEWEAGSSKEAREFIDNY